MAAGARQRYIALKWWTPPENNFGFTVEKVSLKCVMLVKYLLLVFFLTDQRYYGP